MARLRDQRFSSFVATNRRFLAFGMLAALVSSFGQTFFIAFFSGDIRSSFELSYTEFGALYAAATCASGVLLIWFGGKFDELPLSRFTLLVGGALGVAAMLLSQAQSLTVLVLAVFLLRLCGQGLMSHLAITSMARHFGPTRGRAVAVAGLGFPLGEAIFPLLLVLLSDQVGWRATWLLLGVALLVALLPLLLWLLHRPNRLRPYVELSASTGARNDAPPASWTLNEVIRDPRFYRILPAMVGVPFAITAVFFHQVPIAQAKGWSLSLMAAGLTAFALARIASSLTAGAWIDRIGAQPVLPLVAVPLTAGLEVVQ